jgi:hypothetical protein
MRRLPPAARSGRGDRGAAPTRPRKVAPLIDELRAAVDAWDAADPMGRAIGKARIDAYTAATSVIAAATDKIATQEPTP